MTAEILKASNSRNTKIQRKTCFLKKNKPAVILFQTKFFPNLSSKNDQIHNLLVYNYNI